MDSTGGVVQRLRYMAWGEARYEEGAGLTDNRYTGQREEGYGLYFYQARWYDPALGRFAQADSIIPQPGDPREWDRYGYVRNNPVIHIDPSGHCIDVQDGLCLRVASDKTFRVVRGGQIFPNPVEIAIANALFSGNADYLNSIPQTYSSNIRRSVSAAGSQMGYGNFNVLFDQALDPTIPLVAAGVIAGGWIFRPGQTAQSYIEGLEGGNPDAHAWSKHGPYASDDNLFATARNSGTTQTRFASESEMVSAIEQALTTNIEDIMTRANSGKPGRVAYNSTSVSYIGFTNQNGSVVYGCGQAPSRIVFWYNGDGSWGLYTAYPKP